MACAFLLNGEKVVLEGVEPSQTLLPLLREKLRHTGTKEGCAEGDCGACTVLLGELTAPGEVRWRAANACILLAPMVAGKAVLTVEGIGGEGLADADGLHPVQRAMVECHASQCGFCTPGFVLSLYGRAVGAQGTAGMAVADVLQGNLCRCTGYGPILAAGESVPATPRDDRATAAALSALGGAGQFASADDLAAHLLAHPETRIVAGGTDVGLWITKQLRDVGALAFIGDIPELRRIEERADGLRLHAAVTYSMAHQALARLHPQLGELVRRIAGTQVRNMGTVCGNIANASPIGDMPPALIALGAEVTLRRGAERRTLPLERYFLRYGQQDRLPGEFVESVFIPRLGPDALFRVTKLTKRFDSDISAVCGAFHLALEGGKVAAARIAFGGMAGVPARASACEAALAGHDWSEASVAEAVAALARDYQPLDDLRGSASYRVTVAGNLLRRLWHESQHPGEPVSVLDEGLADG